MNDKTITEVPKVPTIADEKIRQERQHFLDEAFLRALPMVLTVSNWTRATPTGSAVVITTQADRIKLGWEIAQEAYNTRPTVK